VSELHSIGSMIGSAAFIAGGVRAVLTNQLFYGSLITSHETMLAAHVADLGCIMMFALMAHACHLKWYHKLIACFSAPICHSIAAYYGNGRSVYIQLVWAGAATGAIIGYVFEQSIRKSFLKLKRRSWRPSCTSRSPRNERVAATDTVCRN